MKVVNSIIIGTHVIKCDNPIINNDPAIRCLFIIKIKHASNDHEAGLGGMLWLNLKIRSTLCQGGVHLGAQQDAKEEAATTVEP
jgi:hypothetical protein